MNDREELDGPEQREVDALLFGEPAGSESAGREPRADGNDQDGAGLAAAVAALEWAFQDVARQRRRPPALPPHLRAALERDALGFLAQQRGLRIADMALADLPARRRRRGFVPLFAAAALSCVAAGAWWWLGRPVRLAPPASAQLAALARQEQDLRRYAWQPTAHAAARGAAGEAIWSHHAQRGFLRLRGLARNAPATAQYQLWIVDGTQQHPVDGGVFDVHGTENLIAIDAKLRVVQPKAFVVTLEKPGGVVVSEQKEVVLIASVDG